VTGVGTPLRPFLDTAQSDSSPIANRNAVSSSALASCYTEGMDDRPDWLPATPPTISNRPLVERVAHAGVRFASLVMAVFGVALVVLALSAGLQILTDHGAQEAGLCGLALLVGVIVIRRELKKEAANAQDLS
jgi:hypothetical protein